MQICIGAKNALAMDGRAGAADHTLDTLTLRNGERAKMENGEPDFRVHADGRMGRSSMSLGIDICRSLAQLLTLFP